VKSKYFQVFLLIGLIPLLALAGVYAWSILSVPVKPASTGAATGPALNPATVQSEISTVSSSLYNDLKKTHDDATLLLQHHTDTDLTAFVQSHPGVSGILVASLDGKNFHSIPAVPSLTDPSYGASDEFKSVLEHLKSEPGGIYQFYSQKFNNPSFVFALDLSTVSAGEVVFDLSVLFKNMNLHGGEAYILDGKSGQYLYATNPSRYGQTFNTTQTPALTKVQTDLTAQVAGISQGPNTTFVYTPFLNSYGLVEEIPQAAFAAAPAAKSAEEGSPLEQLQTPVTLAAVVALAWVFLMFYVGLGLLLGPLKKARAAILAAVQNGKSIGPETLQQFGKDEVGQIVQAASELLRKLEAEKTELERDKEEAIRQARALIENKNKEAQQIQQQADGVKKNLEDTTQQLGDKLKELDALKGMAEGLRGQTEQSKADNAKLKTQVSGLETSQAEVQKKLTAAEGKVKETEAKLLQALSTTSPLQVSQVRSAAIKTMAEELKTTLGIIKGYVSSALGATQGGINEKQQEFLGMVINRSARLEKFINDLLDIYQVEIEQEESKTEDVNLPAEIEGLAFNFQAQAEVKNIKIKVEGKPNLPKVPIVRRRFNQLWNILYLQIIKDAPRGSTISIALEPLGDMVKVSVVDPGLVVKPESLPKLFDEFYDPKHPASAQLAGTGLKFALIKTILAAHGGGAVAEASDPGTTLILTFPTKRKPFGASPTAAIPPAVATAVAPVAAVTPPPAAKPVYTIPPIGPKPAGVAPLSPIPGVAAKPAPTAATVRPVGTMPAVTPGVLDSLLSGNIPSAGLKPAMPAPTVPVVPPVGVPPQAGMVPPVGTSPVPAPRPPMSAAPGVPSVPAGTLPPLGIPRPPLPGAAPVGTVPPAQPLGTMPPLGAPPSVTPRPPLSAAPGVPASLATPGAPRPPMPITAPGTMPPTVAAPSLGAAPRPPMPPGMMPTPGMPGVPPVGAAPKPAAPSMNPVPPAPSVGQAPLGQAPRPPMPPGMMPPPGAPRPPLPAGPLPGTMPTPGAPRPPMPPGMMPPPGLAPRPAAPVVIPTSIKPTAPPEGILDLDNLDSFKVDDGSKPPAPKPPAPPAMDKPIVKNKEGEGEIIE
jgi:signal transduction histidine kinase